LKKTDEDADIPMMRQGGMFHPTGKARGCRWKAWTRGTARQPARAAPNKKSATSTNSRKLADKTHSVGKDLFYNGFEGQGLR